ncbi:MAG TPA: endonuclease domain-containing protein [Rhodanobacteraceae bacterium]|nr:endonuclease domain-containing protein [Rhodanobacteraceae bacterium]
MTAMPAASSDVPIGRLMNGAEMFMAFAPRHRKRAFFARRDVPFDDALPSPLPLAGEGRVREILRMPALSSTARALRTNSSDAERCLWRFVRNRQLGGYRFRRQMPMGHYIVDFVCLRARLVVELDGGQHADRQLEDLERTRHLARAGFRVLRFWNNEMLRETEAVLESILGALRQACPHPSPLPQAGEGE